MQVKRSLAMLLGASMSAGAGFFYLGDEASAHDPLSMPPPPQQRALLASSPSSSSPLHHDANHSERRRRRPLRAISKKDVGLEQSLARDLACWVAEATVYAATQAYLSTSESGRSHKGKSALAASAHDAPGGLHHGLLGWLQELSPTAGWDANRVIQSSSFNVLLNLVAGLGTMNLRDDVEQELYRVVGLLSTNPQCATAIAERATRYGKQALWNLAQAHDVDARLGAALRRMAETNSDSGRFGAANLVSLVSLAVAATELPDEYLEFTYWALQRASASPKSATTGASDWRRTLFGDDRIAKTRRKLVSHKGLWDSLQVIRDRPLTVQRQAAKLFQALSEDHVHAPKALEKHPEFLETLVKWMNSGDDTLTVASIHTAANLGIVENVRSELVARGALDLLRAKFAVTSDPEMVAAMLRAVRVLATPAASNNQAYALDGDALSFMNDSDEEHPLHHDDLVHPDSILKHQYIDGWIEVFTSFLRDGSDDVRTEAALCLEQLATNGSHQDQSIQEWLIAVLDGVLESVPVAVSAASSSVRAAKSRTRPIAGRLNDSKGYEASHAKALRALAFVVSRKESQQELARRGGVQLLQILLRSDSLEVQRETARVLANLFTCDDMERSFAAFAEHDAELTRVLDAWTRSSDISYGRSRIARGRTAGTSTTDFSTRTRATSSTSTACTRCTFRPLRRSTAATRAAAACEQRLRKTKARSTTTWTWCLSTGYSGVRMRRGSVGRTRARCGRSNGCSTTSRQRATTHGCSRSATTRSCWRPSRRGRRCASRRRVARCCRSCRPRAWATALSCS
ncbi:hypothetical protein PINS_up006922 [Pythium insidiosum]|nr:hypothetical protein PINS_up006922 [Pythium insidiosum]